MLTLRYPEDLPVSQRRDEILQTLKNHQVTIIAGETGSGKTTQIPKMCAELGRTKIGHTQPRRIAARAVAERIAEETQTILGEEVGYQVRFTDKASEKTLIKVMTDGILLAELQRDRLLKRYDTLIIDEAHERSLNIDFILGYLKQILPKRPDLKVIITSATIEVEKFSAHFDHAPIIEVTGRTYPVEMRYRPVEEDDEGERDIITAICDAVEELEREPMGDILVFLSGEREIRDTADALMKMDLRTTEVLPLYARLSASEQHRIFAPHPGRRIVLATNVAETSLTVPGIRYVIDPGTARISRFSMRTKVQRLPIEAISQASANQRAGRCGRVAPGVCIRLYSEDEFKARSEYTDPEILRTNLAAVLLQMASIGLGDVENFPFIQPPDKRAIRDGVALLEELHAVEKTKDKDIRLTKTGKTLANISVDPRLGRMLIEASRNGCLSEALIIVSALAIMDPRERPMDRQEDADKKHERFKDENSDFISYLKLWNYLKEQQKELSSSAFRRMCKQDFLNYLRVREWQDLHSQLRQQVATLGMRTSSIAADPDKIHISVLAGLLSHIGLYDSEKRDYQGARGTRFSIFPGSGLFKANPRWVMAAELVETSRLYARINARIDSQWIEPLAKHLTVSNYSEPHWERRPAAVIATERVTLYGIPIVVDRKVTYGKIDPKTSRELFIRHALVEGDWDTHHQFFHDNRALLDDAEELEHKSRRRDIVVDEQTLIEFYDALIPDDVVSGAHFDNWWKQAKKHNPTLLTFTPEMLVKDNATAISAEDFPDRWEQGTVSLRLSYQFEPGSDADGVTAIVPLPILNQLSQEQGQWLVPGLREELITALIKSLPKQQRIALVPAPDTAKELHARLSPDGGSLTSALEREIAKTKNIRISPHDWDWSKVPEHLQITWRLIDDSGHTLGESKNIDLLKEQQSVKLKGAIAAPELERTGIKIWDIPEIPQHIERMHGELTIHGYPALVDEKDSVALRVLSTPEEQAQAMHAGVRKLLLLTLPPSHSSLERSLTAEEKLLLTTSTYDTSKALLSDVVTIALDALIDRFGVPWNEESFKTLQERVRPELHPTAQQLLIQAVNATRNWHEAENLIEKLPDSPLTADVIGQIDALMTDRFITDAGYANLPNIARYLKAITHRLQKAPMDKTKDAQRMALIHKVQHEVDDVVQRLPKNKQSEASSLRWMIEELRVNQFAQALGTPMPISEQRIYKLLDSLEQ